MLDRYLVGQSVRQSPEADVPVLQDYEISSKLGGAANVALSCQQLGGKVTLVSVVGDDAPGEQLHRLLDATEVIPEIIIDPTRPTTVKTRILCNDEHLLRIDRESIDDITSIVELVSRLEGIQAHGDIDVLILQDYNKGMLTSDVIDAVLDFSKKYSIPTAVDPKLKYIDHYQGVDLFKPNRREAEAILQRSIGGVQEAMAAAEAIKEQLTARAVLLTLGADGVIYTHAEGTSHAPALTTQVVDVCGAGDAVLATCSMAMIDQKYRTRLPELAVKAGAIACAITGVSPISLADFDKI